VNLDRRVNALPSDQTNVNRRRCNGGQPTLVGILDDVIVSRDASGSRFDDYCDKMSETNTDNINRSYLIGYNDVLGWEVRHYFTFYGEFRRTNDVLPYVEAILLSIIFLVAVTGKVDRCAFSFVISSEVGRFRLVQ